MSAMNEKKLSDSQKRRIEEIKKEWFSQVDKIEHNLEKHTFSQASNAEYIRLEKKYLPQIKKILKEDNDGKIYIKLEEKP